jgi:hypothetical protein
MELLVVLLLLRTRNVVDDDEEEESVGRLKTSATKRDDLAMMVVVDVEANILVYLLLAKLYFRESQKEKVKISGSVEEEGRLGLTWLVVM